MPTANGSAPEGNQCHALRHRDRRLIAASVASVLALIVVVTMAALSQTQEADIVATGAPAGSAQSASTVIESVTTLPAALFDQVGEGTVLVLPQAITDQGSLTEDGKPLIVYIGAEYCPFCASQRWPVVIALSRFGTFANLGMTHSANDDIYPNTQSFSFHRSSYTSDYLVFQGVELATNEREGSDYAPLDTLTERQKQITDTLDAPPYAESSGAIPFMDLANKYILVGATYDVGILRDKSAEYISDALRDPDSTIAQSVLGTANLLTNYLCRLTGGQPGEVCESVAVQAYRD